MSFCGHSDFTVPKQKNKSGAPVWGSPASKNFFMSQTVKIAQKYDEFTWIADGPKERKNLFAPEIDRIRSKDPATAEKLAAACDAAINFLKHEELGFTLFKNSMHLSASVALGAAGSCKALVDTHIELSDENDAKAWTYKKELDSHKKFILGRMRSHEYRGNELLGYLLMVINKAPQFVGKPPEARA